jgi:ELWxxDGT repeat protein
VSQFQAIGPTMFFTVDDQTSSDLQLWKSDGIPQNTSLVHDFGASTTDRSPANFTGTGRLLFFTMTGPQGKNQVWVSDGTDGGTKLVRELTAMLDIGSYVGGTEATAFAADGNTLFFTDYDSFHGGELWKSDGTPAGTQIVKDIDPGPDSSAPNSFAIFNGQLNFAAHDGTIPQVNQLWMSDGSAAGTVLVQPFSPGRTMSMATPDIEASQLSPSSPVIVFWGTDGVRNYGLWRSDGTAQGTVMISGLFPSDFVQFQGEAFFVAYVSQKELSLYKTDGTASGTVDVTDFAALNYSVSSLTVAGNRLFLEIASNSPNSDVELWASDGTTGGTGLVRSFSTMNAGVPLGDSLLFSADDGTHGQELWISDGTAAGTTLLSDIVTGANSSNPSDLTQLGSGIFFLAQDQSGAQGLYKTDGTAAGTELIKSFGADWGGGSITAAGTSLYITGDGIWKSDGTADGTVEVPTPGITFNYLDTTVALGDRLVFWADDGVHGREPWVSDGTTAGTFLLGDIRPGSGDSTPSFQEIYPSSPVSYHGLLFFAADDGLNGSELWQTDGTTAGTKMVADINPGPGSSNPSLLMVHDGQLIMLASDGIHGAELMTLTVAPPTISLTSGSGQSTAIGAGFSSALVATVTGPGGTPMSGVTVTFSAPATGPSAKLAGDGTAVTDASGKATILVTANGLAGSYAVTASAAGSDTPVVFNLTNTLGRATLSDTPATLSRSYDGVTRSVAVTTSPAGLAGVSVTYNGLTAPPTAAATYTVVASLTNANYHAAPITATMTIARAQPAFAGLVSQTINIGASQTAVSGTIAAGPMAVPGSVTVTLNSVNVAAPVSSGGQFQAVFNTSKLTVGSYVVSASYAGSPNFNPATATTTLLVSYGVTTQVKSTRTAVNVVVKVVDASGNSLGSTKTAVTAVTVLNASGQPVKLKPPVSNKKLTYNARAHTYTLAITRKGLAKGAYTLSYKIGKDTNPYAASFSV